MATVQVSQEQRILLNVTWDGYVAIGEVVRDQPIRMTYNRGSLEIMTTSREHERINNLLRRLFEALTEELNIDVSGGGSMTVQREDLEKGMEPDECYWIGHELELRDRDEYDPGSDPPPDLAIEVEIGRGIINRLGILAALGIPEVWRHDGEEFQVLLLGNAGAYQPSPTSKAMPLVPVAELARFVEMRHDLSDTQIGRQFRAWVQGQRETGWGIMKPRRRKKK